MGIWGSIKNKVKETALAPVHMVGDFAHGHIKRGFGDLTSMAKIAAPFIPGVGWAAAAGLNVLDRNLHDKKISIGSTIKDAASAYGASKLAGAFHGGGGGGAVAGGDASAIGSYNGAMAAAGGGAGGAAGNGMASILQTAAPAKGPGWGSAISEHLGMSGMKPAEKAMMYSQLAGTAMQAYGAHQAGQVQDAEVQRRNTTDKALNPYRVKLLQQIMGGA